MTARAMWKAELALGELKVPVKLYAAVRDTKVHFRLLHAADHAPIKQQMVDPESEQPVASADIKRAVAVDRGVYVVLTEEEQAALTPKPSRLISVEQVVATSAVDERWFDRPYFLGPDGDDEGYFARCRGAREARRCGYRALGVAQQALRRRAASERRLFAARYVALRARARRGRTRFAQAPIVRPTSARLRSPSNSSAHSRTTSTPPSFATSIRISSKGCSPRKRRARWCGSRRSRSASAPIH